MKRREAREKALQTLFQLENTGLTVEDAKSHVLDGNSDSFYEQLVVGTTEHLTQIDESLKS